ncbi:MAG: DUF2950 family protein [Planctomycetota bacterium]
MADEISARTSKAAIWSLICGILSFLCLPALPAIILGIVALVAISNSNGKLKGTGLAIAGMIAAVVIPVVMIPVLAIIAAIVIPNVVRPQAEPAPFFNDSCWTEPRDSGPSSELRRDRVSEQIPANEAAAIASLRVLTVSESVWYQQDPDGNGIKDYWTYDVSCLHRMFRADKTTKVAFISLDLARADSSPAETGDFGERPLIEDWLTVALAPKNGYYFQAMELDENGEPYNQVEAGETGIKATNKIKFGFVAYPAEYGKAGRRTFIVNEQGTVYAIDVNPDIYGIALQWPAGDDPNDPYQKSKWSAAE